VPRCSSFVAWSGLFTVVLVSAPNHNSFGPLVGAVLDRGAEWRRRCRSVNELRARQSEQTLTSRTIRPAERHIHQVEHAEWQFGRRRLKRNFPASDARPFVLGRREHGTSVDLPLPPAIGTNGIDFGSDPAWRSTRGEMCSTANICVFQQRQGNRRYLSGPWHVPPMAAKLPLRHFCLFRAPRIISNDKPRIAADTNPSSPFHDNVHGTWDATSGGSSSGGIRWAPSTDHGANSSVTRIDNPSGPGKATVTLPLVGPQERCTLGGTIWRPTRSPLIALSMEP
jgi:hypothetical protein